MTFGDEGKTREVGVTRPQRAFGSKLVSCPFEVHVDGARRDQFYDVRDATASARLAKRVNPRACVVVMDARTGKLVAEMQPDHPSEGS
jgi:hypothetical protein